MSGYFCLHRASALAPKSPAHGRNFGEHFSGDARFEPARLPNIVPEIDQLKLGTHLFGKIDPCLEMRGANRLRDLVVDVYQEMNNDPEFATGGSALGFCYGDILQSRRDVLHFYEYVPRQLGRTNYPVLVFLHGSLGNFKAYTWVLKRLADAHGFAVIAPTYGAGNWMHDRKSAVLDAVYKRCTDDPELDESTVYLAGLSNGGTGLTREICNHGDRYRGFIFISAVIEPNILALPEFQENARRKPVLLIHGEDDDRISSQSARSMLSSMEDMGLSVTSHFYPQEDHFLLFSKRIAVADEIGSWLEQHR